MFRKSRSTQKVLLATIDVLNERGWKRGGGWNWKRVLGPVCVEGAMMQVLRTEYREKLYAHPAYKALAMHLEVLPELVWGWNDDRARDKGHVIRVLQEVAGVQETLAGHYELVQNFLAYNAQKAPAKSDHILVA